MNILNTVVVFSSIILFSFIYYLFDYLNEKSGNYDRYYNRQQRKKEQRRLDKLTRQADKR